jgi:transcriptional regulator with XRE-family HTH domain
MIDIAEYGLDSKLTDSEKFVIIMQKYSNEYSTQKSLAKEMNISKQSISYWKKNNKKEYSIHIRNRNKICSKFRLKDTIWIDSFYDGVNFSECLDEYKIVEKKTVKKDNIIRDSILSISQKVTTQEKQLLDRVAKKRTISIVEHTIKDKTMFFLFELAKLLKGKNQIGDALKILDTIQNDSSSFKYIFQNQIQHLKAILLSHDTIQDWDGAIHILRMLYSASHYHLQEPEIITLTASNYKRKALYSINDEEKWRDKNSIDMSLLSSALILYREAFEAKENEIRYYDAINFAYLHNIIDSIQRGYIDSIEIKNLYTKLSKEWSIDESNWWEVSSNAEFLMLIGQVDLAISNINDFFDNYPVNKFEIETTLRQLEMYISFTDDKNGKDFCGYLKESWGYIEK